MKRKKPRVARVDREGPAGDEAEHGPGERTARDEELEGLATASDAERAAGADAAAPTGAPAPPPREDEDATAEQPSAAEEFRDDQQAGGQTGG